MAALMHQELTGVCFERVSLRGASLNRVYLTNAMTSLADEQLGSTVTRIEPGWKKAEDFPLREALQIVLVEERGHRLHAERGLTALQPT